jgi:hypothetical protein
MGDDVHTTQYNMTARVLKRIRAAGITQRLAGTYQEIHSDITNLTLIDLDDRKQSP